MRLCDFPRFWGLNREIRGRDRFLQNEWAA
jgi:hypothetical protein